MRSFVTCITLSLLLFCRGYAQPAIEETERRETATSIDSTGGTIIQKTSETIVATSTRIDSTRGKMVTTSSTHTVESTEDVTERERMIALNPVKFWTMYNITYYQKITGNIVVGVGIQAPTAMLDQNITGLGGTVEIRYYPTGKNLRGFYIAPNISYTRLKSQNSYASDVDPFSVGMLTGWQWFTRDNFGISMAIGADQYLHPSKSPGEYARTIPLISYNGLMPTGRIEFSYGW